MAFTTVNVPEKRKRGGGLAGKLIGAAVGGAAGAFAGNPMAGAKLGSEVGGIVGNVAKPGSVTKSSVPIQSAAGQDPEVMQARLQQARDELFKNTQIPEPDKQRADLEVFGPALDAIKRQRGIG